MGSSRSTTEQKATIPAWAEAAAQDVLSRAKDVSRIPYAPYYGPDVAAMTPMQVAAMQGTNQMAAAFGSPTVDVTAGMPTAQNYDGMMAYSAAPMYEAALAELERRQPGTFAALRAPFVDPMTGAGGGGSSSYSAPAAGPSPYVPTLAPRMTAERGGRDFAPSAPSQTSGGTGSLGLPDPMSGRISSVGPIGRDGGGGMGRGK